MLPSWCNDVLTILRPTLVESRGTTVPDWTRATSTDVAGCSVQTPSTGEDRDGRTATDLMGTAYLPPGTEIHAGDRIVYEGVTYSVEGEPMRWKSPTGRVSHIQASISVWRG